MARFAKPNQLDVAEGRLPDGKTVKMDNLAKVPDSGPYSPRAQRNKKGRDPEDHALVL
jgi:hypothetical protein